MKFQEKEFIPVLFGGDINTYSVARAFYEQYGVKSYVFGKYNNGPSCNSKITIYNANPKIEEDMVFVNTVKSIAAAYRNKKVIVLGCGDSYVALASRHKDEFPENVIAPYIDYSLMYQLQRKDLFYELCEKHGLDYPETFVHKESMGYDFELPFQFPVILKPSNGIMYWEHPFKTQNKVYKIKSMDELISTMQEIYNSGYTDSLIIQDTIPGNDENMHVLTCYSDHKHIVKMACLGHVLLEEHTPHGQGNHAVIITEYIEEIIEKVKNLLSELEYTGFSNFDIKYDSRDGKYKFFEINTRQGRSNFYVTGSGLNIAKYVVCEYVKKEILSYETSKTPHLWLVVPKKVALNNTTNPQNKDLLQSLLSKKEYVNPVFLKGDFILKRWLRMVKQHLSHYSKFKKYYNPYEYINDSETNRETQVD